MFRVGYRVKSSPYGRRTEKEFCSFASAMFYFLQKFHEAVPDLRLEVVESESLEGSSCNDASDDK